jgi:hypothetical protein
MRGTDEWESQDIASMGVRLTVGSSIWSGFGMVRLSKCEVNPLFSIYSASQARRSLQSRTGRGANRAALCAGCARGV